MKLFKKKIKNIKNSYKNIAHIEILRSDKRSLDKYYSLYTSFFSYSLKINSLNSMNLLIGIIKFKSNSLLN